MTELVDNNYKSPSHKSYFSEFDLESNWINQIIEQMRFVNENFRCFQLHLRVRELIAGLTVTRRRCCDARKRE